MQKKAKSSSKSLTIKMQRVEKILPILRKAYPDARCSLDFKNEYELLVATILAAQCTDARVNLVTPAFFKKYPDFETLSKAKPKDVEVLIRSTGFFNNKTKALLECSQAVMEKYKGKLPQNIEELTQLRGVGRKTANVVLGNAMNITSGVVVDTHVGRLSRRLGLTKNEDAVKVEMDLQLIVPREDWVMFSHYLVFHGRNRCMARTPDCGGCEILDFCPRIGVEYKPAPKSVSFKSLNSKRGDRV